MHPCILSNSVSAFMADSALNSIRLFPATFQPFCHQIADFQDKSILFISNPLKFPYNVKVWNSRHPVVFDVFGENE